MTALNIGETQHSAGHLLVQGSRGAGWDSVLVEEFAVPGDCDEFQVAAVDAQRVVLATSGHRYVESGLSGRWRGSPCPPGNIGMTAPGVPTRLRWRSTNPGPVREVHVHLPGSTMRRVADDLCRGQAPPLADALSVTDPIVEPLIIDLMRAARLGAPELYAETGAEFLAAHLILAHGHRPAPLDRTGEDARVGRALRFMRDNLQRPLTLAEIAQAADLSPYHFARVFKAQQGRTPFRHLVELRVREAGRYLEKGTLPISEIAYLCGFSSHAALSATFVRMMGVTPSAYRAHTRGTR